MGSVWQLCPFAKNTPRTKAFPPQAIFLRDGSLRKQIPQPVEQTMDLCIVLRVKSNALHLGMRGLHFR